MDRAQLLNDSEETTRIGLHSLQSTMWTSMPAIVKAVHLAKMTCDVQISIQGVMSDENGNDQFVNYPLLVDCPIVFPSAGGFILTFPIAIGDEVLVNFGSRCIDSWWQSGGIGKPMEARMHDLSDGFVIPGPKSQPNVISDISSTSVQLRNSAGSSFIEIDNTGNINIKGNVIVTGTLTATGEVTGDSATTPVHLTTHHHTGVTTGAGVTGGPVG